MDQSANRAILLASLTVFSIIAMSGAASGEIIRGTGNASYNVTEGKGNITNGGVIFQGEDDIIFRNDSDDVIFSSQLRRPNQVGGEILSVPVPVTQRFGEYNNRDGFSVTVDTPQITTLEILNNRGRDIRGEGLTSGLDEAVVNVDYNFEESERIELTVERDGVDVTEEIVNNSASGSIINGTNTSQPFVDDQGSVQFNIRPSDVDQGEYIFTVEGEDDFDFGQSSETTGVTLQTPRIREFQIIDNRGRNVAGGTLVNDQDESIVRVDYNYAEAERIELTVKDEDGGDVTDEIVNNSTSGSVINGTNTSQPFVFRDGFVRFDIDPSELDPGEYTFTVEGEDNLDTGEASRSVPVTIADREPTSITFKNKTIPVNSTTIIVESAQLGTQLPTNFVVVVHQTDDGTFTGEIGTKIGESFIISNESQSNVIVNLSPLVSENDAVAQLANSQTLIAVLHRANSDGGTNHGEPIIRNGSRVSDRAQITVEREKVNPTETETGTENDGFGALTAFIALLVTFLGLRRIQQG